MITLVEVLGPILFYLAGMPVASRLQYIRNESRRLRGESDTSYRSKYLHMGYAWGLWGFLTASLTSTAFLFINHPAINIATGMPAVIGGIVGFVVLLVLSVEHDDYRIIPGVLNDHGHLRPVWATILWPILSIAALCKSISGFKASKVTAAASSNAIKAYKNFIRPEIKIPDAEKIAQLEKTL